MAGDEFVNARAMGATGDGKTDDAAALQRALDLPAPRLYLPEGEYVVGHTLVVRSHTRIVAHERAVVRSADGALAKRGDYLMTNAGGDEDISIEGGVWDGNNQHNPRGERFDPNSVSGTMLAFRKVRGLRLANMTLRDPVCYYIRLCEATDFVVEDIFFDSRHIQANQDGVHLAGYCERGAIRRLRGSCGSPNDDFVAFNADDCLTRQENYGVICGPIRDVCVEDIRSERCHTFIRLLSVDSEIANVTIRGVYGGCENYALNMDAARYCLTPLVTEAEPRYHAGVGRVHDVSIEDVDVRGGGRALLAMETDARNLTVSRFRADSGVPTAVFRNTGAHEIAFEGLERPETLSAEDGARLESGTAYKPVGGRVTLSRGGFSRVTVNRA